MSTLMALLRKQFGMEGQESISNTQEVEKTGFPMLLDSTLQTTKLRQLF
jgi:hypothetical protein